MGTYDISLSWPNYSASYFFSKLNQTFRPAIFAAQDVYYARGAAMDLRSLW